MCRCVLVAMCLTSILAGNVNAQYIEVPQECRKSNYSGGSCVFASCQTAAWYQHIRELSDFHTKFSGGSWSTDLRRALDTTGCDYAMIENGDVRFLEYAITTGRPCMVGWYAGHATNLVGLTKEHAVILDNNHTNQLDYIPREQWIQEWKGLGGWAVVFPHDPPATPLPALDKKTFKSLKATPKAAKPAKPKKR